MDAPGSMIAIAGIPCATEVERIIEAVEAFVPPLVQRTYA
ncbi:hypothetical protein SAMN04487857_102104 [Pseudomonas sp. ok272]|nr:hypothetical protein SAMN04487857_102104 [Pseudomonas sp. ok272]SFM17755.1 hypothetical protein SAMN04487858_101105 [Pseudomonas sp. ok602]